jgi:hypothetical protein
LEYHSAALTAAHGQIAASEGDSKQIARRVPDHAGGNKPIGQAGEVVERFLHTGWAEFVHRTIYAAVSVGAKEFALGTRDHTGELGRQRGKLYSVVIDPDGVSANTM